MKSTVRYCINCGKEIGSQQTCDSPDCGGIPNFYRDIPGPDSRRRRRDRDRASPPDPAAVAAERTTALGNENARGSRMTVPIETTPVAVLRSIAEPVEEHTLAAGQTEIGAVPPARILLDHPEISSKHASIECTRGTGGSWRIILQDRGSTNGTYVNGQRVERCELHGGERVRFASLEFKFHLISRDRPRMTVQMG